jgi:hypothetical protein
MAVRIEWRSRRGGDDSIVAVDDNNNSVIGYWTANLELLTDFLNDMKNLDPRGRNGLDTSQRQPQYWGDLVLSRDQSGDVLDIEPQLYWEGIAYWYRSRGLDPHTTHLRR